MLLCLQRDSLQCPSLGGEGKGRREINATNPPPRLLLLAPGCEGVDEAGAEAEKKEKEEGFEAAAEGAAAEEEARPTPSALCVRW